MEKESFTIEEEVEITYVSYYGLLASHAYIKNQEDKAKTLTFIKSSYPKDIQDIVIDTLEDILTLHAEMGHFDKETTSFQKLGEILAQKTLPLLEDGSFELNEEQIDEFFSYTMYIYESLILLDECDYDLVKAKEELDNTELNPTVIEIIKELV